MQQFDVIVIGAGAAGLMCAIEAGKRGRRVLVLDHANKIGKKILLSGGGRCNFTNLNTGPGNFLSRNPHFCKSALARYRPEHFIALVERHRIPYHEKKLGQLFCDESAKDIVRMLAQECKSAGVRIATYCSVSAVEHDGRFRLQTTLGGFQADALVVATGGLSFPKMGASGFGYDIARRFGLPLVETRAALVPFTLEGELRTLSNSLSGVSLDTEVATGNQCFRENMLFTHRGLSGPAILQISSYWHPGQQVEIDLLPGEDALCWLRERRSARPKARLRTVLSERLPNRLVQAVEGRWYPDKSMQHCSDQELSSLAGRLKQWRILPSGTEGYRTAEVTLGGIDTRALSSQTMEARDHPGLYFVGEVVDVTGWLGGNNFQWAWASGYCAGQVV